jgi:hypothetical protein
VGLVEGLLGNLGFGVLLSIHIGKKGLTPPFNRAIKPPTSLHFSPQPCLLDMWTHGIIYMLYKLSYWLLRLSSLAKGAKK